MVYDSIDGGMVFCGLEKQFRDGENYYLTTVRF
jgi:hypothetical protein